MGEEETKPKVEHKPKKGHHGHRHFHAKPKFKAPTPGLEDVVFTTGLTKDAVEFEENKKKLGRYIAVTFKAGGATVQRAIETMMAPTFNKPADLTTGATKMQEKEWEMGYEEWRRDKRVWEEVKPRAFQLFLQHCGEETEQKLNS
jgi:hypothetical protein